MNAGPPAARLDRSTPTLVERASAVLRDEIANGALANLAVASQAWSAPRRNFVVPEMTRRLETEVFGLRDAVLDLIAPPPRSTTPSPRQRVVRPDHGTERPQPNKDRMVKKLIAMQEIIDGLKDNVGSALVLGHLIGQVVQAAQGLLF